MRKKVNLVEAGDGAGIKRQPAMASDYLDSWSPDLAYYCAFSYLSGIYRIFILVLNVFLPYTELRLVFEY